MWLYLHDAVPTQYLRFRRHLSSSSLCTRCNQLSETILHCFRNCGVVRSVWVSLGFSDVSFFASHEVHDWFKHDLLNEGCSKFAAIIWSIWQDRNIDNFQGVFGSPGLITYKARSSSQWVMGCSGNFFRSSVIKMELWSIWKGLTWAWKAGLKLILRRDWDIYFELILREANVVADWLAKIGFGGSGADEVHF
ncbi:hypothetical protein AHAS_Ahas15G0041300 [Arachis hypogaea]